MRKSRALIACGDSVQRAIETFRVLTPIGEMVLNVCSRGLHMIYQVDDITDENFSPDRRYIDVNIMFVVPFLLTLIAAGAGELPLG